MRNSISRLTQRGALLLCTGLVVAGHSASEPDVVRESHVSTQRGWTVSLDKMDTFSRVRIFDSDGSQVASFEAACQGVARVRAALDGTTLASESSCENNLATLVVKRDRQGNELWRKEVNEPVPFRVSPSGDLCVIEQGYRLVVLAGDSGAVKVDVTGSGFSSSFDYQGNLIVATGGNLLKIDRDSLANTDGVATSLDGLVSKRVPLSSDEGLSRPFTHLASSPSGKTFALGVMPLRIVRGDWTKTTVITFNSDLELNMAASTPGRIECLEMLNDEYAMCTTVPLHLGLAARRPYKFPLHVISARSGRILHTLTAPSGRFHSAGIVDDDITFAVWAPKPAEMGGRMANGVAMDSMEKGWRLSLRDGKMQSASVLSSRLPSGKLLRRTINEARPIGNE